MPKWTEYTSKNTLADNDEVMLYDATARANKRGLMSKFWDYVVDKMATAVISKLETDNKTIIGAINALNSDKFHAFDISLDTAITSNLGSFKCGIAKYSNAVSDAPEYGNGFLISIYRSKNNICQIAIPENSGKIYSRTSDISNGILKKWN